MSRMCIELRARYLPVGWLGGIAVKRSRKRTSESKDGNSRASDKQEVDNAHLATRKSSSQAANQLPNTKAPDLPPNEEIHKHADEVYGDTEILERKPGT